MEEALTKGGAARASRCGVIRTRAVPRLTTLYLLRLRFLIEQPDRTPRLAEEVQIIGHTGAADNPIWLDSGAALALLEKVQADANIGNEERRELVSAALAAWEKLETAVKHNVTGHAEALTDAHRRIRQAMSMKLRGLTVKAQMPPDLLGLLVLQPLVEQKLTC